MKKVDARGFACPLPLTMARRRLAELAPGDELLVLATDPEAAIDLAALAADAGRRFEERAPGEYVLRAAPGGPPPGGRP